MTNFTTKDDKSFLSVWLHWTGKQKVVFAMNTCLLLSHRSFVEIYVARKSTSSNYELLNANSSTPPSMQQSTVFTSFLPAAPFHTVNAEIFPYLASSSSTFFCWDKPVVSFGFGLKPVLAKAGFDFRPEPVMGWDALCVRLLQTTSSTHVIANNKATTAANLSLRQYYWILNIIFFGNSFTERSGNCMGSSHLRGNVVRSASRWTLRISTSCTIIIFMFVITPARKQLQHQKISQSDYIEATRKKQFTGR